MGVIACCQDGWGRHLLRCYQAGEYGRTEHAEHTEHLFVLFQAVQLRTPNRTNTSL
jgi:hypothetical protein